MYREIDVPSSVIVAKESYVVYDPKGMGVFRTHNLEGAKMSCDGWASRFPGTKFVVIGMGGEVFSSVASLS